MSNLYGKKTRKLNVLARIFWIHGCKQEKNYNESCYYSLLNYCPLVWLFYSREMNNKTNRIHEKSLRLVYSGKKYLFLRNC